MGRHSSDNQWPYYWSVAGWLLPWAIMASIAIAAVWVAVDTLGKDDASPIAAPSTPTPAPETTEPAPSVEPSSPEPTVEETPEPEPEKTEEPDKSDLITSGISVQVLNGTNSEEADDLMADRLSRHGFEIVAVGGANKTYVKTTVFWSFPEAEKAARALAARFGWVAEPKPGNLSSTVDLHVVVGLDEA